MAFPEEDALAKKVILIMTIVDVLEDKQSCYVLVQEASLGEAIGKILRNRVFQFCTNTWIASSECL